MLDENSPQIQDPSNSTSRSEVSLVRRPEEGHDSSVTLNVGKGLPVACVCPMLWFPLDGARFPLHLPTCVFYEGHEGPRDTLIQLRSHWLNLTLQASSTSLVSGHSFSVRIKRLVPNGSGAFGILERRPPWGATDAEVADFSAKVIVELRQSFIRSESSVSDEQHDGRYLLSVACSIAPATAAESLYEFQLVKFLFQIGCGVDNSSADMKNHPLAILLARGRGDRIGNIVNLFCGEHGSCGVVAQGLALPESVKLLSFRHAEGCPIHTILSALESTPRSNPEVGLGSTPSSYPAGNVHKVSQDDVRSQLQLDKRARIPDLGTIIQSHLQHLQTENQTAPKWGYRSRPNRPFKVPDNLRGALLYSAADDPVKLARTLDAWPDLKGKPALMLLVMAQAARVDSIESVRLLLRLGTPITSSIISASNGSSMSIFLIEELVKRRQYLRDHAFEVLPPEDVKQIGLLPWTLPDINLLPLCSVFRQHGFDIGLYHQGVTHVQSVFHASGLSPDHIEALWGVGFRDIDVPDEFGHTPLVLWDIGCSLQRSLDRAEWLIQHGADLHRRLPSNSTSVCHHVCLNLMHKFTAICYVQRRVSKTLEEALEAVYKAIYRLEDPSRSLVGTAFRSLVADGCMCHCSINGCTPLTVSLRHIRETIKLLSISEDIREESYKHDLVKGVYEIILMNAIHHGGSPAQVVQSVLRLLTFDALGLTHTCCREDSSLDLQPFSKVDGSEIHDEERLLLTDLESLVNRFENEYEALGIPLWDFVETHWSVQMTKHVQSKGESIDPSSLCTILASGLRNDEVRGPCATPNAPGAACELAQSPVALTGAELIAKSSSELLGLVNNLASSKEFELVTEFLIYLAASLTRHPYAEISVYSPISLDASEMYVDWMNGPRAHSVAVAGPSIGSPFATAGLFVIGISIEKFLERLLRRQVPRGYGRLTWTCQHCQRTFTETVKEMFPGAASDWVHRLNQAQVNATGPTSVGTSKSTLAAQFSQGIAVLLGKVYRGGRKSPNITTPQTLPQSGSTSQPRAAHAKYLLLAIPSYRKKGRLIHLDIQDATTDEQLYRSIRQVYNTARRRWRWVRLRSLSHIEWKQFYIYHSDKIALSRKPEEDWPQCGRASCETGCKVAVDYEYSPRPAHVDPPIPREALMHFLENPDHAGSKIFHRDTVPKRDNFLSLGPNDHLREGWCLAFIETMSWARIAAIEGVIGVGSLVFAIAWTETHGSGSISDAFAPSCWMLALGAIVLTLMYHHEQ